MKVLICYVSAGNGHRRAAEAVYDYLAKNRSQYSVRIIDALDFTPWIFRKIYGDGYLFTVRYFPFLWGFFFRLTAFDSVFSRFGRVFINMLFTGGLRRRVLKERPDVVISTHFMTNEVALRLREKHGLRCSVYGVITDFGVHPYWIVPEVDKYVVACGATAEIMAGYGVKRQKLLTFGIPVAESFTVKHDRDGLRRKFGLASAGFVVLLIGGTVKRGVMEELIRELSPEFSLLIVCGKDRVLEKRLRGKNDPSLKVFGYVNNMQEFMSASDVVVTKPGGLSIAESINVSLPMVFVSPIPGQEEENIRILSGYGVGVYARNIDEIKSALLRFKNSPAELASAKASLVKLSHPGALADLCAQIDEIKM